MKQNARNIFDRIKKAEPEIIGAMLSSLLSVVIAGVGFLRDSFGGWMVFWIILGGFLFGSSVYAAFSRESVRGKKHRNLKYPRIRPYAIAMIIILLVPVLYVGAKGLKDVLSSRDDLIIIIANFDGPNQEKYRVTDIVWKNIYDELSQYEDVSLVPVDKAIEESGGIVSAQNLGVDRKADIVIWGWYGVTDDKVILTYHFQLMPSLDEQPQACAVRHISSVVMSATEINGFSMQADLSEKLTYLTLMTAGITQAELENWSEAADIFTAALGSYPDSDNPPAEVYYYRGNALLNDRKLDSALIDLDNAIRIDPEYDDAILDRGKTHYLKKEYEEAIKDYQSYHDLGYGTYCSYTSLGISHYRMEDYPAAIEVLSEAIDIDRTSTLAYKWRAYSYEKTHENLKALADYQSLYLLSESRSERYRALMNVYRLSGKP